MFLGSAIGAVFLYRDVKRGHMLEADAKHFRLRPTPNVTRPNRTLYLINSENIGCKNTVQS